MSADQIADPIAEAAELLRQKQPPGEALRRLEAIAEDHPAYGQVQHLRGICAMRLGDPVAAKDLFLDAMRRGERHRHLLLNLAGAAASCGMPSDALTALLNFLRGVRADHLLPFVSDLVAKLGFADNDVRPDKDAVFEGLLLPLLAAVLAQRKMDVALHLEIIIYEHYVKTTETEAHFGACMEKIAPLFVEAGRYWRDELKPLPPPSLEPPYRVGFFVHNASTLAHVQILLTALKAYRTLDEQPYEPIVYCFGGNTPAMGLMLAEYGVRLVMLNQRFPETAQSYWERLLRLRELISEDGVQELVWVSRVTMMPLAFGLRIAPVQVWWCMKYHNFSLDEIDGYLCVRQSRDSGMLAGRRWRMAMLGADDWYDPGRAAQAAAIRASFDAKFVLMSLGRVEKMREPEFLKAVVTLLQTHADAVYLWAGREQAQVITDAFEAGGVLDRAYFIGWVDTLIFAQVADIFIDTFPFPCGITLVQSMAAGKPVVLYDSPEAAQTGVWNLIKARLDGDEGTAEERAALRELIGDPASPKIAISRTPEEYVAYVSRLMGDPQARAAASQASLEFVERYYSDIRGMATSLSRHFVEMIEERRAAG